MHPGVVDEARETLRYMGLHERGAERDRRPTEDELKRIEGWLAVRSDTLTVDHNHFILDSGFRPPSVKSVSNWPRSWPNASA